MTHYIKNLLVTPIIAAAIGGLVGASISYMCYPLGNQPVHRYSTDNIPPYIPNTLEAKKLSDLEKKEYHEYSINKIYAGAKYGAIGAGSLLLGIGISRILREKNRGKKEIEQILRATPVSAEPEGVDPQQADTDNMKRLGLKRWPIPMEKGEWRDE